MTVSDERLTTLKNIYPGAKVFDDGGNSYVFLPLLTLKVGDVRHEIDGLLCPSVHGGYETRLFLAEPIAERQIIRGQPANWTEHSILGRTWHSWSWQGVSSTLPLPQMLLAHMSALR